MWKGSSCVHSLERTKNRAVSDKAEGKLQSATALAKGIKEEADLKALQHSTSQLCWLLRLWPLLWLWPLLVYLFSKCSKSIFGPKVPFWGCGERARDAYNTMFNDTYGVAKNEVDVDLLYSIVAVEAGNLNCHTRVPLTAILEQVNHFDRACSESYDNDWAQDIPLGQIDIVGFPLDENDIRSLL